MKRSIQVLLLNSLIININCICSDTRFSSNSIFDEEPLIEAFSPRGLRVSINDIRGTKKFEFYFKIDEEIFANDKGPSVKMLSRNHAHNGRLIVHSNDLKIKEGSTLNYWIRIEAQERELIFPADSFKIMVLIPKQHIVWKPPSATTNANDLLIPEKPIKYDIDRSEKIKYCECDEESFNYKSSSSVNLVHQWAAASLRELILFELRDNYISCLLIYIEFSSHTDSKMAPIDRLKLQLTTDMELYDLNEHVLWAKRSACGIIFEMTSIVEKKRIEAQVDKDPRYHPYYTVIDPDIVVEEYPCSQYEKRFRKK